VTGTGPDRARAADLGLAPRTLPAGPLNAITDVPGIRVGHTTVIQAAGDTHGEIRTGVTAIVHDALIGRDSGRRTLPAGLAVFNGFGKITGSTQIAELGTIETPVLLTGTLSVFRVADALLTYLHELPGFAGTTTLNPVVAETNDGFLSDIWARPVTAEHVRAALDGATSGPVAEGCVGAGTGTGALGFKAGIGTSSRQITGRAGQPRTVGAIVQANFSGLLTVCGVPVPGQDGGSRRGDGRLEGGRLEGGRLEDGVAENGALEDGAQAGGNSCVIVLATDAPVGHRDLERLANCAFAGLARAGSDFSGSSGDYALAISTATPAGPAAPSDHVPGNDLDVLFAAAIEATEEAILNSLFMAVTTTGYRGRTRLAVPLGYVRDLLSGRPGSPCGS
jgi:D-aminopeptidase